MASSRLKSHPLLLELSGSVLHEVNNSAQFLAAVDALTQALGDAALEGRSDDVQDCAAQLAAQAQALRVLAGGPSDPSSPVCDTLCALVRKRLQRERRELRFERVVPVDDATALDTLSEALRTVRAAPEGMRFVLRFDRAGPGRLAAESAEAPA